MILAANDNRPTLRLADDCLEQRDRYELVLRCPQLPDACEVH